MTLWRLIPPFQASGAVHMALDAWLLEQHIQGKHPPTLRFYTWEPVAISLGYHQRQYPDHWNDLVWQGRSLDIVRRPTGGRAVLHQGDLTYAVITSGLSGSRMESYRQICEFLIQGWRSLGVDLHYGNAGRGYIHNPNCFGTATAADLVLSNGYKLIGSAQKRQGNAILQHGSIRLNPDIALFQQVFQSEPIPSLPGSLLQISALLNASMISDCRGRSCAYPEVDGGQPQGIAPTNFIPRFSNAQISMEQVISTLMESAKACFDIDFQPQPLSESEWKGLQKSAHPAGSKLHPSPLPE